MEQRQLDWETRDVELEDFEEAHSNASKDNAKAVFKIKKQQREEMEALPNPDLPLAQQLEKALQSMQSHSNVVDNLKQELGTAKKQIEDLLKKLRETEASVIAKERIINDLRLQVPSSVNQAMATVSVTGESGLVQNLAVDYESKQALHIAQATVTSLRDRLSQKEETLQRYENLLKQTRQEHAEEVKRRHQDNIELQSELRRQKCEMNELRSAGVNIAHSSGSGDLAATTSSVITQQAARIAEMEGELQEFHASISDLSNQLATAKSEADKHHRLALARQKECQELKENVSLDQQMQRHQHKQELDKLRSEINVLKQENIMINEDAQNLRETQDQSPSAILKSLVEKLRNDLAEKEKKQRAMSRAITDLKQELLNAAEDGAVSFSEKERSKSEDIGLWKKKVEDLHLKNDKLTRQLKGYKEREINSLSQVKTVKEELAKKQSQLIKLKEEKTRASTEGPGSRVRFTTSVDVKEKEELRATIRRLEEKLRDVNQAEKPLEDVSEESKALRNIEEVARWDERKKWEHKVDVLKKKLAQADEEVSKLCKSNNGLKETVRRMEREKLVLEGKVKVTSKASTSKTQVYSGKIEELEQEKHKMAKEIETLKHQQLMGEAQGVETLKLRNKLLHERIETQERKISALMLSKKVGGSSSLLVKELEKMADKEKDCLKQKHKLEEENMKLKMQLNSPRLLECKSSLEKLLESEEITESIAHGVQNTLAILNGEKTPAAQKPPSSSGGSSSKTKSSASHAKEVKALMEEVQKHKDMTSTLVQKVKEKDKKVEELEQIIKNQSKRESTTTKDSSSSGSSPTKGQKDEQLSPVGVGHYSLEHMRQMEADLKRKSDLLAEVKVLLKHAAERERGQLAEAEELKKRMRLILEVDPKSPSEVLAKELRQIRLTVERLKCEKRELENQIINSGGVVTPGLVAK